MNREIIINVCVVSDNQTYLIDELDMIKPAILYADTVTLTSGNLMQAMNIYKASGKDMLYDVKNTKEDLDIAKQKIVKIEDNQSTFNLFDKEITISQKSMMNELINNIELYIQNVDKEYIRRIEKFTELIDDKVIICDWKHYDLKNWDLNDMVLDYINSIFKGLSDPRGYTLVNEDAYYLVKLLEQQKIFSEFNIEGLKHAKVMNDLIVNLPNFNHADIDEIIDIKVELAKPLLNFRGVVFEFSEQIKNAPWDKDFEYECKKLYYRQVVPAINEIDQKVKDSNILKNIFQLGLNKNFLTTAATGMTGGIISGSFVNGLVTGLTSLGVGAISDIGTSLRNSFKGKEELNKNKLYFYYKVGKRFEKK